jgi:hypothetical protein
LKLKKTFSIYYTNVFSIITVIGNCSNDSCIV